MNDNEQDDEMIFKQYRISEENVEIFKKFRIKYREYFPENFHNSFESIESLTDDECLRLERLDEHSEFNR
ncbi:hypothetical protein BLA29_007538 [Euroglyphus maynei]|uniref:Uncharacterized protein n=1 Tax=Euroglyphus maynei TaxID=6958 RepID=A0A1Y3AXQ6_EURMA|nr:hypothetical protein BLA29_007538 [Euroglyphus maynei]